MFEQIESCGKGVGCIAVEVVFGHLIVAVIHTLESLLQILLNHAVSLGHSTAVVVLEQILLRHSHVGDTDVGHAKLITAISLREHIDEDKVVICPRQICFAATCRSKCSVRG